MRFEETYEGWNPGRLAAEQGYANAQYNLGKMYAKGQGVIQDYKEALKWYKLAAAKGYKDAGFIVSMYELDKSK